ncbi:MAG: choline-sulfatase [Candidatus Pelagisphaera sp.]
MAKPNILFLLSDEHSFRFFSHLSESDGGEPVETPHLDRLASQSAQFSNTYCQMPLCTPSRLCLLTGKEVRGAGAWKNDSILAPELATLPGTLRTAGYETCLVGKMHLGGSRQYVGFQHRPYGDLTGGTGHQGQEVPADYDGNKFTWRIDGAGPLEFPESALQEQVLAQETVAWVREHRSEKPEKPWFVCASFSRPHFPLTAPKRWLDRYKDKDIGIPKAPASGDSFDHPMCVNMRKGFEVENINEADRLKMRIGYFACVSYLDEILGDLLTRLELSGDLENTIIVYSSDHGEMAGEHGSWWKQSFHEASARVPMMISLPEHRDGSLAAQRFDTPVALIDLFPTFCDFAGAEIPLDLNGISLRDSASSNREPESRPVVCDNLIPRWGEGSEFRMVRYEQFKYIHFRNGSELFFDLQNDPLEQRDLCRRGMLDVAQSVLEELREFVKRSMDFDAAEQERIEGTARLAETYSLKGIPSHGNLYHLSDGRIVNGEEVVYNPTVVASGPEQVAGSDWKEQNTVESKVGLISEDT